METKKDEEKKVDPQLPAKTGETEVALTPPDTIGEIFTSEYVRMAIKKSAPKHLDVDRFLRIANTALTRTPKLQQSTKESFFNCLVDLSSLGLEPDGRNAHLIPFDKKDRRGKVLSTICTLIVDYKGIVSCVRRSGEVSDITADIVCENDDFEYDRGRVTRHKVDFRQPRGNMFAAYSYVLFKDGAESYDVMSKEDIDKIRNRSKTKGSGPWVTDYNEMSKKTVFRRHSKWLPFSAEIKQVIEADDRHQFSDLVASTISETDIRNMDDGTRMSIKNKPAEPQPEAPGVIDAETTDEKKYPSREVMIESFATMGGVQYAAVFDEAGVRVPDEEHPMSEEDIRKVYDVIQAQKGAK